LLLQACWNFERMQNLGLAYGLEPWLQRICPNGEDRAVALRRHAEYFNTNPCMAPLIVGMLCALEEEAAQGASELRKAKLERLAALKRALGGALAGIGDALFWQTLRPFSAAAALALGAWLWHAGLPQAAPAMALFYLAVYNIPAVSLRWKGFLWGYQWREQIALRLKDFAWQAWIRRLRLAGTVLGLLLVVLALAWQRQPAERALAAVALLAGPVADRILARAVPAWGLYAGAVALGSFAGLAAR
jgi:mannose/fructose/N-acetylgalactosamine-specific phosphotransferase system component IID